MQFENKTSLVISILMMCFTLTIVGIFSYYLYKFSKEKFIAKAVNKIFFITFSVICFISFVLSITGIALFESANKNSNSTESYQGHLLGVNISSIILLLIGIVFLIFFVHHFAIKLTENAFLFLGEKIDYKDVTSIILDPKTNNLYINFKTARSFKRIKYTAKCNFKKAILDNADKLNLTVQPADADQYFKELTKKN
ncbi:Uncharacterised protein [Mycoplasma putrefaciens]|uniref:DUF5673 domain-containing protein n=1 Tax=Mycoplasma putrefaciens (strain ATCC 15718 / NCTC 10155 / C30 KS-1 / KS-1) TaxID=743965 RepID=A0A7U3ZSF5_MYCPK|nr:hypothetical protein [Mycoplasma putrefaciens]AEM68671.1 uncharacterized protein MPUT_0293 [Mycoplasma putrefaciens KS1]SYV95771.1 Uncharacterised protein [Mycoplasma putrefaciens]